MILLGFNWQEWIFYGFCWGFNSDLLWWSIYWNLHLVVGLIQGNNTDCRPLFYHARFDFHGYMVGVLYFQVIWGWIEELILIVPYFVIHDLIFLVAIGLLQSIARMVDLIWIITFFSGHHCQLWCLYLCILCSP